VLLLAAALAGVPAHAPWAQVNLPALGESASQDLTVGAERRLGQQIMRDIRRDPDYLDDPVLLEYLQSLWQPLVAASRRRGNLTADTDAPFAWEAFLVRDRSVNAFALPGGYVGVHLGLIALTASRDELASVLAHELSHVTQRHIARSIDNSSRTSMLSVAGMILAVLAASRAGNSDMANAAILGGQAASAQGQLNFSRDMEREADRVGFGVLSDAGFASAGMASMFEKLDAANRLNDSGAYPYLRSHPLTVDRLAEARSRVLVPAAATPASGLSHALMQARARVLMDPGAQALRRQQAALTAALPDVPKERLAVLYAGALASSLLGDHARAAAAADEAERLLAARGPRDATAAPLLDLLQAQLQLARGDTAAALKSVEGLEATRAVRLVRAQAALDAHRRAGAAAAPALRESVESLQTWLADHPQDATAWAVLSASAERVGLRLRALRADAEAQYALGDLAGAEDRLRAAQRSARGAAGADFIEASVIDARLRQVTALRRQLAADARGGRGEPDAGAKP
jgi:predicted Zn-dependent protease